MTRDEYQQLQAAIAAAETMVKESQRHLAALWITLDDMRRANGFEFADVHNDD